jgi:hypothetical protein
VRISEIGGIMEIIASSRGTGKTTKLMHECHEANMNAAVAYMVVHDHKEAYRVAKFAEEQGLIGFRFPLTYEEFLRDNAESFITTYYIDNADMLLQYLAKSVPIAAATINIP